MNRAALFVLAVVSSLACKKPEARRPNPRTAAAGVELLTFGADRSTIMATAVRTSGPQSGRFTVFRGDVELNPDDIERTKVRVNIDPGSIVTQSGELNTFLKSAEFFDSSRFRASFQSTSIRRVDGADAAGASTHIVTGDLTLHDQTRAISFPATLRVLPTEATVTADFSINRMDFGIRYVGPIGNMVRPDVAIHLDIRAPRARR